MKNNIPWIDLTRIIACFLVVFAHCCDPFVGRLDQAPAEFLSGAFWGSFYRPCVPLFVMISGVLLLPVQTDLFTFYKKRMMRVVTPLAVWSLVTPFLFYLYFQSAVATANPNIVLDDFTLGNAAQKAYTFIFNFNYDTTPLWYLYMLVGLYIALPVISPWLAQASKKELKTVLCIWLFTTALPYITMIAPTLGYQGVWGSMDILGECAWNAYGTFYYFSGFIGYVILAYYLVKFPLNWSWRKTLSVAIPLWLAGYALTSGGFLWIHSAYPDDFSMLEVPWLFCGTNVLMMTFSAFIVLQKVSMKPSAGLSKLASLTFGIYLCHFLIVQLSYDLIYPFIKIPPYLQIPLIAVVAFGISTAVVWLLSKLPKSKYIIG